MESIFSSNTLYDLNANNFPFTLSYTEIGQPGDELPLHWHDHCEFLLVIRGTFSLTLDIGSRVIHDGDCVFIPCNMIHGGIPYDCMYERLEVKWPFFLEYIRNEQAQIRSVDGPEGNLSPWIEKGSTGWYFVHRLFEVIRGKKQGYELAAAGLLLQFTGEILQDHLYWNKSHYTQPTSRVYHIKKAMERIRLDYPNRLTLEDLAKEASMEPKNLCRHFRDILGLSPMEYLNSYRVEQAAYLLATTDHSISDIASRCGFYDASYFGKMFLRYKDITATEYRKKYKV